ncbi:hypothetical protein [Flavobacterium sp.]|uniref:hypothetical protein n=1 Tax=Flavobacterium sp. TaxID=239 RepID=UPI0025E1E7FB|nr:hypothetical protein [Flavobacterium sp.]
MKKIVIFTFMALLSLNAYSQKKTRGETERSRAKTTAKSTATAGLAKADNLVVEIKKGNFQLTINENGKEKDAVIVKPADANFKPTNCKLIALTASGAKLYLLTWTEVTQQKSDLKTEDITTNFSVIYEITSKKQVFSNTQTNSHIIEKVFLDKNKTASETREKMRKDGFELVLNPDGTLTQKGKKQDIKWVYDATKMEYVVKK